MLEFGQADATSLFLYHAIDGEQVTSKEDMRSIEWCVKKCYFCKGDGQGYHYHPLALEALGRQLGCLEVKPSQWMQVLSRVWKFSSFSGEKIVFDVLRSSFDLLQPIEQTLFMDVGFFLPRIKEHDFGPWRHWISWKEQLCVLYKMNELEIQSQLDSLRRKGFLQDADLTSGRITMHDLYHGFVILEAIGKYGATVGMWDQKWMLVNGIDGDLLELEIIPTGGCWRKLSRLSIHQEGETIFDHLGYINPPSANLITSLKGIKWQYFSNVLVLQLYGLRSLHGSLNLKSMTCLQSLQLYDLRCLKSLEGLESLKHLTCFDWQIDCLAPNTTTKTHVMGQFSTSLKYLYISGQCVLSGSNVLARCNNLIKLYLTNMEVGVVLDLSNCLSLESVELYHLEGLQILLGLIAIRSSRLQALDIRFIYGINIPGLDQLDGLVWLYVAECGISWEMSCLLSLTKLQALTISSHAKPAEHCIPHQLQELYYHTWTQCEAPCLNAFKQLQILDLSCSFSLTQMYGIGDLPALQSLNLTFCIFLEQLPDLSKSRSLEELNLDCCKRLELYEEDFIMLARLPLLHPVRFSRWNECSRIRLDVVRRKVLRYFGPALDSWLAWKKGEWEELELGLPLVELTNRGIWDSL